MLSALSSWLAIIESCLRMNEQTNSKQNQTRQYEPFHIFSRSKNSVSPVSAGFSLSTSNTLLEKILSLSDNFNSRYGRRQRVKQPDFSVG